MSRSSLSRVIVQEGEEEEEERFVEARCRTGSNGANYPLSTSAPMRRFNWKRKMPIRALTRSPRLGTRARPTLWLRKGRLATTTGLRKKRNSAKRPRFVSLSPIVLRPAASARESCAAPREKREHNRSVDSWDRDEEKGDGPGPSYQGPEQPVPSTSRPADTPEFANWRFDDARCLTSLGVSSSGGCSL